MKIIAGPCQHETLAQSAEIARECKRVCDKHGIEYYFKASYDKANRTSASGIRGVGLQATMHDFQTLKDEYGVKTLTDVHNQNEILKIAEKALKKWDINYISIIHRIGKLFPKDKIVYVGVSSKHRQNAFNACNFIMDYLKTNATFWKIEEFENENKWVIQDKKEIEALKKWS